MDCETFDILGRWEIDRGPQNLHYDFWWNLPRDYMVTSEWGLPPQFENGIVPEELLANWPWTLLGIMPTNRVLMATDLTSAGSASRALLVKWNGLHAVRTGLGAAATLSFLWALP